MARRGRESWRHAHQRSVVVCATRERYVFNPSRVRGRSSASTPLDGTRQSMPARRAGADWRLLEDNVWCTPEARCAFECTLRHEPHRAVAVHASQRFV